MKANVMELRKINSIQPLSLFDYRAVVTQGPFQALCDDSSILQKTGSGFSEVLPPENLLIGD